jgi:hypothetical protein
LIEYWLIDKTKITVSQVYDESYDKNRLMSNKYYQNGVFPDEVSVSQLLKEVHVYVSF